jgi:hypothetical protein
VEQRFHIPVSFKKIAKCITGFSTPVFGISWNPPDSDREIARKILLFLEDLRALFYTFEMELPIHVIYSVLKIRKHLINVMLNLTENSDLLPHLKAMRAVCRKYLDLPQFAKRGSRHFSPDMMTALGEFRGLFGIHIAQICVKYGLDIDDELASILPVEDVD